MAEINPTQLRSAVAWSTGAPEAETEDDKSAWEWFWEAIQGDFNEDRSTGQIVADAAISMIPLVDQVCDVRDLVANCKKLRQEPDDTWSWVALGLTLIGLFPVLGSLVKGVLKVFFSYARRGARKGYSLAIDAAMTCVIALLRREECQRYLRYLKVDDVFAWLSKEVKRVKGKIDLNALVHAFDKGVRATRGLVAKVEHIPHIGAKAKGALDAMIWVRARADSGLEKAYGPINEILSAIIMRLERESLRSRHGLVNVENIHFRGVIPESTAISKLRDLNPRPSWINEGFEKKWDGCDYDQRKLEIDDKVKDGWPSLHRGNVESFHKFAQAEIKGPARLYRIIGPNSRAMSDCWISEKVFIEIQNSPDPRATWRKYFAVWPYWNANGQFVVFDIKHGETLKVWKGPASSQANDALPGQYLEGGGEQIIFKSGNPGHYDNVEYYKLNEKGELTRNNSIDRHSYVKLTAKEQAEYVELRENINHPSISGPFETGWGYIDFDGEELSNKIGLPALPGQITKIVK